MKVVSSIARLVRAFRFEVLGDDGTTRVGFGPTQRPNASGGVAVDGYGFEYFDPANSADVETRLVFGRDPDAVGDHSATALYSEADTNEYAELWTRADPARTYASLFARRGLDRATIETDVDAGSSDARLSAEHADNVASFVIDADGADARFELQAVADLAGPGSPRTMGLSADLDTMEYRMTGSANVDLVIDMGGQIDILADDQLTLWGSRVRDSGGRQFVRSDSARTNNILLQADRLAGNTSAVGIITATFPEAYTATPEVVATVVTGGGPTRVCQVQATTLTTVSFRVFRGGATLASTAVVINWIAYGPRTL